MKKIWFPIFSVLILRLVGAQPVDIFVSTKGNDKNNGSLSNPFKTINRALLLANNYAGKNVSIQLIDGTYYLDNTIVISAEHFSPISLEIKAFKNEPVIISAGRRLQLKWTEYKNGIFQAKIPAGIGFERLYINGQLQVLARYPNYDSSARIFHGVAADAISLERVRRWKDPAGGYVHALHAGEWGGFHYKITGVNENGELQLEGGWQNNRPAPMHKQNRFVENIFEELDAPNEWFLDKKNNILYFYPPKNLRLETALVEVSGLKNSIELHGTANKPLRNISLNGLNFTHNERSFMDTKEPLVRSDWTIYRGGAVLMDGTENCTVKDCGFTGLGGNAIMLSNYNRHDTISGCLVADIGASAICFVGNSNAVRSPLFKYEATIPYDKIDKMPGPQSNDYPQQCTVTDCLLHNLGDIEKQATGVEIEMASEITVSHNSIYNTPRAGINIGDGCWGGHVIEYNDVFNTVLETGDHGAFNAWGRDRYWNANRKYMDSLVAVHPELVLLDVQKQIIIRNNRFRCDHGWDIDLDDGSSNYHIYNNVCLNGGLKLREGFYRIVENNILVNNSFHPHVWFNSSGDVFMHNIVMKKYAPVRINDWGKKVDSNLFPDSMALALAQKNSTDKNSLYGNPLFGYAATGDYMVITNSPALKIGFQNFPMNEFGVQKPSLKKMALRPVIPQLQTDIGVAYKSAIVPFLGGTIKTVDGLGERSVYGLPDETGVIVISTGKKTLLTKSGLLDKDVIVLADGQQTKDVHAFQDIVQAANWKGKITVSVFRNQQLMKLILLLK